MVATTAMKKLTTKFLGGTHLQPEERLNHIEGLKLDLASKNESHSRLEADYDSLLANGASVQEIERKEAEIASNKNVVVRLQKQIQIAEKQHEAAIRDERAARENERQAKAVLLRRELRDELLKSHKLAEAMVPVLSKVKNLSQRLDEENAYFRAAGRPDLVLERPLSVLARHLSPRVESSGGFKQMRLVTDPINDFKLRDYWPNWPDRTEYQYLGRIGEIDI